MSLSGTALKQWYDEVYWTQERKSTWRPLDAYRIFLDYLEVKPSGKLLDVACGSGLLLKVAGERGLQTFGIDFSETACAMAKKAVPAATIHNGPAEKLPFPEAMFDYLTCLGSLEHFDDPEAGLQEMVRVCKPQARLCILVPNAYYLFDIVQVWKHGDSRNGTLQPKETLGTLGSWRKRLESQGLTVLSVHRDKEPLDTSWRKVFSGRRPTQMANRVIERFLQNHMPVSLGYQFAFICEKSGSAV